LAAISGDALFCDEEEEVAEAVVAARVPWRGLAAMGARERLLLYTYQELAVAVVEAAVF
jgi:hypothetical protein